MIFKAKNFIILIVMLLILFSLYNSIYIGNNYVTYEKYKNTIKKYKLYINDLENKIDKLESKPQTFNK